MGRRRKTPERTTCQKCGLPLPEGRRSNKLFCDAACRSAYSNALRGQAIPVGVLSQDGLGRVGPEHPEGRPGPMYYAGAPEHPLFSVEPLSSLTTTDEDGNEEELPVSDSLPTGVPGGRPLVTEPTAEETLTLIDRMLERRRRLGRRLTPQEGLKAEGVLLDLTEEEQDLYAQREEDIETIEYLREQVRLLQAQVLHLSHGERL